MNYFVAETAIIEEGVDIGDETRIWYFSHVMTGTKIGKRCSIGERVFIGKNVMIGDNVKICNGVNIYEGAIVKDNVFIGNNVSFKNVNYPRAWRKAREFVPIIIEENATVDANAVLNAGVRIGKSSTVGAGAIVVNNVSDGGIVVSPKAECICDREECYECSKRKEKNLKRHQYHA